MRITTGYALVLALAFSLVLTLFSVRNQLDLAQDLFSWADQKTTERPLASYQPITVTYQKERLELYDGLRRNDLKASALPPKVAQAFIAIEDQRFYQHDGYDITGILRAFTENQSGDNKGQGGSTITQQLARMTYLSTEKTYTRKIKEILIAMELEQKYSKKELLTAYVNQAYFANNIYGIELAATSYLGKHAEDLSWAEVSYLAAIPNNPSLYNPLRFPKNTGKRQQRILKALQQTQDIPNKVRKQSINVSFNKPTIRYPDYIDASVSEAIRQTAALKNLNRSQAEQYLHQHGAVIQTYLDPAEQTRAKQAIQRLPHPIEGAYVGIDGDTRGVTALVGNKSNVPGQLNRAVQSYRQPGSTLKPLLVYGPYLEKTKKTLTSRLDGSPVCFDGYCPQNSSNRVLGSVTIADAIAYSYNTPALRAFSVSFNEGLKTIRPFRFSQWTEEDNSYNSALGGLKYGVSPLELTNAYTTLVNDGLYSPSSMIRTITTDQGTLYRHVMSTDRIWSSRTNQLLRKGLHNVMTYGTGRLGYDPAPAYIGGKTGTTNDNKDMWFVGMKNQHVGGIWIGADIPRAFPSEANSTLQVRTWASIVQ